MTATANFRQTAQYIGLAICGLIIRTAFGVFGILWGIIAEIVNGVFRVAIGVIVGKSSVSCPLKPSDSAPLKHSTMPP